MTLKVILLLLGVFVSVLYIFRRNFVSLLYKITRLVFFVSLIVFFVAVLTDVPFKFLAKKSIDKTNIQETLIAIDSDFNKISKPINDVNKQIIDIKNRLKDGIYQIFNKNDKDSQTDDNKTGEEISLALNLQENLYPKIVDSTAKFYRLITIVICFALMIISVYFDITLSDVDKISKLEKRVAKLEQQVKKCN